MKVRLSKFWAGVKAGLTTPDAVKAEKALGAIVAVRLLVAFGASASLVELALKAINAA